MALPKQVQRYIILTKPGIIIGNLITTSGGFFLAAQGDVDLLLYLRIFLGTALIIASGCVYNNYIDRKIDAKMARTKHRAMALGKISAFHALTYATVLGAIGFLILYFFVNELTALIGFVGITSYVIPYGYWKRRSIYGTMVGSISGAVPPVAGYTSVTNQIDTAAILLYIILIAWQMPHFYAIAIYRFKDYAAASLPVLPVKRGVLHTKKRIMLWIVAFIAASSLLTVFGVTGYTYLSVMLLIGLLWLFKGIRTRRTEAETWAKGMFRFSLIVILVFSSAVSFNILFP